MMVERHGAGQVLLKSDVLIASITGLTTAARHASSRPSIRNWLFFSSGHDHQHPTHNAATRLPAKRAS